MRATFLLLLLCVIPAMAQRPSGRELRDPAQSLAPYVTSPQPIVDRMLDLASVKPGEIVYDLGCGDGRILITAVQRFRARGVGVELSERLVRLTNESVRRLNLQDSVQVTQGHLLQVDLSDADVVTIYLDHGSNDLLRPNLEKFLKPGARVVSHDFEVRGWKPSKVEKIHAYNRDHMIFLYELPGAVKQQPGKK